MANDVTRLYGRDRAVELVDEFLTRHDADGTPQRRQLPAIVFTGPRGSGKTALLDELSRQLDQQAPFAKVDCEVSEATSAWHVLSMLAFEFNRRCGDYGRLAFPRFVTGELIIAEQLDLRVHERAYDGAKQALSSYRKIDKLRQFLVDTAPEAISSIPGLKDVPGVSAAGRYLPELILGGLVSWRRGRRMVLGEGQDWWGDQDRGLSRDPIDVLVDLNRLALHTDVEANRREVAELMWAAFLADLRAAFGQGRRANKLWLNCAVLIDNVDTPAGLLFLEEFTKARRQRAAHQAGDPDPLTVVATSRGVLSARITTANESVRPAEEASYADYRLHRQGGLDRWWYPVSLRDLTHDEIGNMVADLGLRDADNRRITTVVHRFTTGHPASTRLMLDAIAERPDEVGLRAVLEGPEPGVLGPAPITVEQRLLSSFLRGIPVDAIDDVVTCAAARDMNQASRLATREWMTGAIGGHSPAYSPELWVPVGGTVTAVLHPALRRLLLRRLATRAPEHPANWFAVHDWLRQDCTRTDHEDEAGELHHALALGQIEVVARRLSNQLSKTEIGAWLTLLRAVTRAPNRLNLERAAIQEVRELTRWVDAHDTPLEPLARLITGLWISEDSLCDDGRHSVYLEIAAAFDDIAPYSYDGLAELRREAARYRGEAAMWD